MGQQRRKADEPVTILAIADEERPALTIPGGVDFGPGNRPDLLLSAGDLDFRYVTAVADAVDVPCVMVPGNHDPSLEGFTLTPVGWVRAGRHDRWPGPAGAWAADRDIVDVAGLRIAGLGGCARYSSGPNQWTDAQARRRARRVLRKARRGRRNGRVDVLLTHAPGTPGAAAAHVDGTDPAHRALPAVDMLVDALRPALHLHGHIHLHGADRRVFSLPSDDETHAAADTTTAGTDASGTAPHPPPEPPPGARPRTLVVNTVGWTLTRVHPPRTTPRAELILKGR
ncbi:metallophosphoesterase [Corynebacterium freneyi]|uniref:metallophosphoesterase family protein n=1 Tax=Corynebacterium freneyi TaxID=134034 RepID=UPI00396C3CF4